MNRRDWLARTSCLALGGALSGLTRVRADAPMLPEPTPAKLPRWRGFNLLSLFNAGNASPFPEKDFELISELGFNFVRLPLDYRCWLRDGDWSKIDETAIWPIDRAVGYGELHGIHVQINFHRAPGYTVARPPEPKSVWTDREALDICTRHWVFFAKRFQGVPNRLVSFNLFNEPNDKVSAEDHRRVVEHLIEAIRAVDQDRLIVCDGRHWANEPPVELKGLNVAAARHVYAPMPVTHYKASWANWNDSWPEPKWPLKQGTEVWDRDRLRLTGVEPWKALEAQGFGVMVGEFGCHNQTPHPVVLAWMRDVLDLCNEAGWGWAQWNFRGSFGVLDSGRNDVAYEDFHGHKLDRAMLELLQAH